MNNSVVSWQYAFFSAHICRYYPHINFSKHLKLYTKWKNYHQKKRQIGDLWMTPEDEQIVRSTKPAVFVAYHLGNHLQITYGLAQLGFEFDVLLDRAVYERSEKEFERLYQQLNSATSCKFLFADDPTLLLKIRRNQVQGKSILIFADGATSAAKDKDLRLIVPFLGHYLSVKKGIAFISYKFKMDILPLLMHTNARIAVADVIRMGNKEDIQQYSSRAMSVLFDLLGKLIYKKPWLWECWAYIHQHHFLVFKTLNAKPAKRQIPLLEVKLKDRLYYFNRSDYTCRPKELFPLLE